jgi:hypothetical protein
VGKRGRGDDKVCNAKVSMENVSFAYSKNFNSRASRNAVDLFGGSL